MTTEGTFAHIRPVDFEQLQSLGPTKRFAQRLLDGDSGAWNCMVSYIQTPAGGGSPEGRHLHPFDQIFYVLSGQMSIEVDGATSEVGPGTLIIFPKGVPHRNWNEGTEPTVHLAFNVPLPDPNEAFAVHVDEVP